MPGLSGITVCERIRLLPAVDRGAIVFVTAQQSVETFEATVAAGGDDDVTKAYRPSELVNHVRTASAFGRARA